RFVLPIHSQERRESSCPPPKEINHDHLVCYHHRDRQTNGRLDSIDCFLTSSTEVKLRPSDGGVLCPEVRRTPYISTCRGGNDLKLQSSEVALFGAQALHRTISPSPKPCGLARGELG
ncbi:hypothetical protein KUCAC02_002103, partial [Chaenocephalus aceratus]